MSFSDKGKGKRSQANGVECKNGKSGKKRKTSDNGHGGNSDFEFSLNSNLNVSQITKAWKNGIEMEDASCRMIKEPFPCCTLRKFAANDELIRSLADDLQELEFVEKNNDLYKFKQSDALQCNNDSHALKAFQVFLKSKVKPMLEEITGISLNDNIDMFCAKYDYTDYLLCHDDELEGRRIAYIWYLVPEDWSASDGGALDLFDRFDNGEPRNVVKSLVPSFNNFSFFEVSPKSFHQVAEVLSQDKTRLTLGGWFHGPTDPWPQRAIPEVECSKTSPRDIGEDEFFKWINPTYLDPVTQSDIQESFESSSEISLKDFLNPQMYELVRQALRSPDVAWKRVGPANKRNYEVHGDPDEIEILKRCVSFLQSDALCLVLSSLTGLKLHPLAPDDSEDEDDEEDKKSPQASSSRSEPDKVTPSGPKPCNPKSSVEIRKWSPGCYTLIRDGDQDLSEFALDARLFFNCNNWSQGCGGYSSYVARNEDEELLTAQPEENTLVLVYRDSETLKFVKRVTDEVNHLLTDKCFHDISLVYYE